MDFVVGTPAPDHITETLDTEITLQLPFLGQEI